MQITKKSEDIIYKAETADVVIEINGKTVRVRDWCKQDSEFSEYDGDTEFNEDDMELLTEEERDAVVEYFGEVRDLKDDETLNINQ